MSRAKAQRMYDNDPLAFAAEASDFGWFAITGHCGACGLQVGTQPDRWTCCCTDCGCGPHPAFDIGRGDVPHEQPDLFGGAA